MTRNNLRKQCSKIGAKLLDHDIVSEQHIREFMSTMKYIPEWSQSLPREFRMFTDRCRRGKCLIWNKVDGAHATGVNAPLSLDFVNDNNNLLGLPLCSHGECMS